MATRPFLAELAEVYGREAGVAFRSRSVGGVDAARLVRAGERFDVVVLASGVMQALEAEGHVVGGSRVDIARSNLALAVAAGAPCPPIDDEDAVKAAILRSRAIGYSTGPSGDHLMALVRHWGLAEAVSAKLRRAPPGTPVAALLAGGEADLGVQQLGELLHAPGVEVLGLMPPSLQAVTVFSAGVGAWSEHKPDAGALISYLASPETTAAKRRQGLEPAT